MTESEQRERRNEFAPVSLVVAILGLIVNFFSAAACIGVGAAAMILAALGIRTAVRLDRGMAMSLFGLAFGFVAVVVGTLLLGKEHGGTYSGLAPAVVAFVR